MNLEEAINNLELLKDLQLFCKDHVDDVENCEDCVKYEECCLLDFDTLAESLTLVLNEVKNERGNLCS